MVPISPVPAAISKVGPLASCEKDFEPGMGLVSVSDDPDNKRVTASVPLLAEAVAERRGEFGCIQLNDKEIAEVD